MGLVDQVEIGNPTQPHCATVLLLDVSGSMDGEKIAHLNKALISFKDETIKDDLARKRVDLAVLSFGGSVRLVQDFCSIEDFEPPVLSAGGGTPLGEAILKAADMLEERKHQYKQQGIDYYRPWVFMITDGEPTDMEPGDATWNQVVTRVRTGEAEKKFLFFAVAVEPADLSTLALIAPQNRPPVKLIGRKFAEMFSWLSKSQAKVSSSKINDNVQLENPVAAGWSRSFRVDWVCEMDVTPQDSNGAKRSRVFGSSVIGPMHLQGEIPCQDACAYAATAADTIVIAVADGLGSATRSDVGASLAVSSAFSFCMDASDRDRTKSGDFEELVRDAAGHAREELERFAEKDSCNLRDLACTLIVAIATGRQFAVAHIGDGAVVGEVGGLLSLISSPAESEYTNEVVPLTSREWQDSLRTASGESSIRGIAVFTDGCQRAAFRKVEDALVPFERFFTPVFNYARQISDAAAGANEIAELLASAKLCEHSDDDKTLVVGVIEVD